MTAFNTPTVDTLFVLADGRSRQTRLYAPAGKLGLGPSSDR